MRTRAGRIAVGYLCACAAATVAGALTFLPLIPDVFSEAGGLIAIAIPFVTMKTIVFALVPSLAAIVYAERYRVRSRAAHLGIGALVGGVALLLQDLWQTIPLGSSPLLPGLWASSLFGIIPGAVGGLVYHRIAGRNAGGDGLRPPPPDGAVRA